MLFCAHQIISKMQSNAVVLSSGLFIFLVACSPNSKVVRENTGDSAAAGGKPLELPPPCAQVEVASTSGAPARLKPTPQEDGETLLPVGTRLQAVGILDSLLHVKNDNFEGFLSTNMLTCVNEQTGAAPVGTTGGAAKPAGTAGTGKTEGSTTPLPPAISVPGAVPVFAPKPNNVSTDPVFQCDINVPFPDWLVPGKRADCSAGGVVAFGFPAGAHVTVYRQLLEDRYQLATKPFCYIEKKYLSGCK